MYLCSMCSLDVKAEPVSCESEDEVDLLEASTTPPEEGLIDRDSQADSGLER